MRDDERQLFQSMINEVYDQFRNTVAKARNLPIDTVTEYADGRVMTGSKAVQLKFADAEGTYEDAVQMAARLAGLKSDDYRVFKPHRDKFSVFDLLSFGKDDEDDDLNSLTDVRASLLGVKGITSETVAKDIVKTFMRTKYMNQPMMILPGYWE